MEPRPFQAALLDRVRSAIRDGARRVLIQLPTGGGKTFIAACIMSGMVQRGRTPWFLAHRRELLEQTSETFAKVGLEHGWIASKHDYEPERLAQLAGVHYAARRMAELATPTDIITDEAHHATAQTYRDIYEAAPDALSLGLSATPERLDGTGLGDVYDVMVQGPSVAWLIEEGWLSPYRYFAPGQPDLTGVRTRGGDFARDEVSDVMGKADLIGDAVDHYLETAKGEQGITFGVDRRHSQMIADSFNRAGIAAAHVDGSMSDRKRAAVVSAFRRGDIKIMSNVDLFGEGFDVPNLVYLGMFRPTQSLALCMQMWGRALRIMEGKEAAIICDHAGNTFRHGLPDDERKWTLEGHRKKGGKRVSDAVAIHQCPMCYQVTRSQLRSCPCGYVFPIRDRNPAWEEGQLFELTPEERKKSQVIDKAAQRKKEEAACKTFSDFYDLALARGYKSPSGWASQRARMKRGRPPGGRRWRSK